MAQMRGDSTGGVILKGLLAAELRADCGRPWREVSRPQCPFQPPGAL